MLMNNQTIIAVPITVETPGQTRQFLVRLVEKLDIILGNRGGDPYVSNSQLQKTTSDGLTILEKAILTVISNLLAADSVVTTELLAELKEQTDEAIDDLKSSSTINDADTSKPTLTAPPTQTELQDMSDRTGDNATDFNDLLTALRGTGIIAT